MAYVEGLSGALAQGLRIGVACCGIQNLDLPPNGASIWSGWCSKGKIVDGSVPKGSYEEFLDDIKLAAEMGMKAFRFSFDWSRYEFRRGAIDGDYLKFCDDALGLIRSLGMESVVTLVHFDHPQWFEDMGGFAKKENHELFYEYVGEMVGKYKDKADTWITLDEPMNWVFHTEMHGYFPPGRRNNLFGALRMLDILAEVHNRTYPIN